MPVHSGGRLNAANSLTAPNGCWGKQAVCSQFLELRFQPDWYKYTKKYYSMQININKINKIQCTCSELCKHTHPTVTYRPNPQGFSAASHGQHLQAKHSARRPHGPVLQKGSKDTDPPPDTTASPLAWCSMIFSRLYHELQQCISITVSHNTSKYHKTIYYNVQCQYSFFPIH